MSQMVASVASSGSFLFPMSPYPDAFHFNAFNSQNSFHEKEYNDIADDSNTAKSQKSCTFNSPRRLSSYGSHVSSISSGFSNIHSIQSTDTTRTLMSSLTSSTASYATSGESNSIHCNSIQSNPSVSNENLFTPEKQLTTESLAAKIQKNSDLISNLTIQLTDLIIEVKKKHQELPDTPISKIDNFSPAKTKLMHKQNKALQNQILKSNSLVYGLDDLDKRNTKQYEYLSQVQSMISSLQSFNSSSAPPLLQQQHQDILNSLNLQHIHLLNQYQQYESSSENYNRVISSSNNVNNSDQSSSINNGNCMDDGIVRNSVFCNSGDSDKSSLNASQQMKTEPSIEATFHEESEAFDFDFDYDELNSSYLKHHIGSTTLSFSNSMVAETSAGYSPSLLSTNLSTGIFNPSELTDDSILIGNKRKKVSIDNCNQDSK